MCCISSENISYFSRHCDDNIQEAHTHTDTQGRRNASASATQHGMEAQSYGTHIRFFSWYASNFGSMTARMLAGSALI